MIWEGFRHRICFKPEITGHKVEPDHFAEKTLRGREPAVSFHVWLYPRLRGTSPSWSDSERKRLLRLKRGGLTSISEPCPNPMEANDVMGEQLRSQRSAPGP